jgi:hypothetical protein
MGVSLDPLESFSELAWRTQQQICQDTSALDGLGTYEAMAGTFSGNPSRTGSDFKRKRHRAMQGGRAFNVAYCDVWQSTVSAGAKRRRSRILTELDRDSGLIRRVVAGSGVAVRLEPRLGLGAPNLGASCYFFQAGDGAGGGTWWFTGSADVRAGVGAPEGEFSGMQRRFLKAIGNIADKHRVVGAGAHSRAVFLESCMKGGGGVRKIGEGCSDEEMAGFSFAADVLDRTTPAYLRLVSETGGIGKGRGMWNEIGNALEDRHDLEVSDEIAAAMKDARTERIGLAGGAVVESSIVESARGALWRFCVQPAPVSAAGRLFQVLRRDGGVGGPCVYL